MKKIAWTGPLIVLVIWLLLTVTGIIKPIFVPNPFLVIAKLFQLVISGHLLNDVIKTLLRFLIGYAVGCILGVIIGTLMGRSEMIYSSLESVVDFFRSIPVAALFPLFLLFFGTGELVKIATTIWATALIVLVNTMYGVRNINSTRLLVAQTMRFSKVETFFKIILPDALPQIFAGLRIGISIALIVVVMTEMFMGTFAGLGLRIYNASLLYRTSELYAAIIVTGGLGYFLNKIFVLIERKTIHWVGK